MPILKAPPVETKNETLQLRVSQDLKFRLMRYAEFIHASAAYVVSAALENLFRKDREFQEYLANYRAPQSGDHREEEPEKNCGAGSTQGRPALT
jgi:predicted transcriptional regulator